MSLFNGGIAKLFFNSRAIGDFTADCTIRELSDDELEITEDPVERGAAITDHAYIKPAKVQIEAIFDPLIESLNTVYKNLLDLQKSREPFTIGTGKRKYTNMLIKSLNATTDRNTENVLSIKLECQQIIIVESQTTQLAGTANQQNPEVTSGVIDSGDKKAQTVTVQTSALSQFFGLFGIS